MEFGRVVAVLPKVWYVSIIGQVHRSTGRLLNMNIDMVDLFLAGSII